MKQSSFLLLVVGGIVGGLCTYAAMRRYSEVVHAQIPPPPLSQRSLKVTLYRYELKPDKLDHFEDWIQFEHAHHAETVETLEREKMYFEAIFRDRVNQKDVIYWLAINGEGGGTGETSPLEIDKKYDQFERETLKKGSRQELSTEYFLVPEFVTRAITQHERDSTR